MRIGYARHYLRRGDASVGRGLCLRCCTGNLSLCDLVRAIQKRSPCRVAIRRPTRADGRAFLAAVRRSRVLHHPWVCPPSTREAFEAYVARDETDAHHLFLVIHKETGGLVGVINVNNVIRGNFQSAFLGYYAFVPYAGQGLMTEGMQLVLEHAFGVLKLHRLEANIQPGNRRSLGLVRKCGFVREGFSRRYLKVYGRWADHQRWAVLAEAFSKRKGPRFDRNSQRASGA